MPQAPPSEAAPLYLQYAGLEEEHGLARAAMEVCAILRIQHVEVLW